MSGRNGEVSIVAEDIKNLQDKTEIAKKWNK
jgi:hypothetical protein